MKDLKILTSNLTNRVKAETPSHFKRFRKYGLIAAGLGVAIKLVAVFIVPPVGLVALAPELITIGLTVAGVSQTARK